MFEHNAAEIVTVTTTVLGVQGQDSVTETAAVCVTMVWEVWEVDGGPTGWMELEIEVARLIADELETPWELETLITVEAVELVWAAEGVGPLDEDVDVLSIEVLLVTLLLTVETVETGVRVDGTVETEVDVVVLLAETELDACTVIVEVTVRLLWIVTVVFVWLLWELVELMLLAVETVDTGVNVEVIVKTAVDVVVLFAETELDRSTVVVEVTVSLVWTVIVVSVWPLWELVGLGETVSMGGVLDGWVLDDWVIVVWGCVGPKERVSVRGGLAGCVKVRVRVWPNTVFVSIETEAEVLGTVEIEVRFTVLGTGDVPISTDELWLEEVKDEACEVLEALEEVTWVLVSADEVWLEEEVVGCVTTDSGVGTEVEEEELECCQQWKDHIGNAKSAGSDLKISGKTGKRGAIPGRHKDCAFLDYGFSWNENWRLRWCGGTGHFWLRSHWAGRCNSSGIKLASKFKDKVVETYDDWATSVEVPLIVVAVRLVVSITMKLEVIRVVESSVIVEATFVSMTAVLFPETLVESSLIVVTTNSVLTEVRVLVSTKVLRIITGWDVEEMNEVEELSVVKAPRADEVIIGPGEVARAVDVVVLLAEAELDTCPVIVEVTVWLLWTVDSVPLLEEEALLVTLLAVDVLGKTSDAALIVDDEPDTEEKPTTVDIEGRREDHEEFVVVGGGLAATRPAVDVADVITELEGPVETGPGLVIACVREDTRELLDGESIRQEHAELTAVGLPEQFSR
jgi:hypothetical protein